MRALAQYVMRGPLQAGGVAALATVVPYLSWIGAAVVGLVVLRLGVVQGLNIGLWALLPAIGWAWFGNEPSVMAVLLLVFSMAVVLRGTMSWERSLLAGSALGLAIGLILPTLFPGMLAAVTDAFLEIYQWAYPGVAEQLGEDFRPIVSILVQGLMPGSYLGMAVAVTVLARYWQALLYNPGGFGREFHGFRLSRRVSALCVLLLVVAPMTGINPVLLGWVAGLPLLVAGIALVHGVVGLRSAGNLWLVAFYALLVVLSLQISLLLMLLAIVDSWLDFRRRIGPAGPAE
ncbi:hypothetical protein ACFOZ5_10365 [Marinobacter lacisalsi]|uniref:DUF2232 domain-containing protein n=1 Tax=Marinobacter lacisalsi TaxID=475979 RepID=A0ABV8QGI0_9GAMM